MIGPQPGDKTKKYTVTQASFKRPLYLLRSVTRPDLQYSIGLYCNKVLIYNIAKEFATWKAKKFTACQLRYSS